MGNYEERYHTLEREGTAKKREIEESEKKIRESENEIKSCTEKINLLDAQRQKLTSESPNVKGKSIGQSEERTAQIEKESSQLREKITFLTGQISSLKVKISEAKAKLNSILGKLSEVRGLVSNEKSNFDSTRQGIRNEAGQIKGTQSSAARQQLGSAAGAADSMFRRRQGNEKEIDGIIAALGGRSSASGLKGSYSGRFTVDVKPSNSYASIASIPLLSLFSGKLRGGLEQVVGEMQSPAFVSRMLSLYSPRKESSGQGEKTVEFFAQQYYYMSKIAKSSAKSIYDIIASPFKYCNYKK